MILGTFAPTEVRFLVIGYLLGMSEAHPDPEACDKAREDLLQMDPTAAKKLLLEEAEGLDRSIQSFKLEEEEERLVVEMMRDQLRRWCAALDQLSPVVKGTESGN